ncbi:MAG TPA: G/U mismatch-specific DNA glycosylase [Actinocatenispora sp.]
MRPTPDQLAAAAGGTVPDVVAPGLTVLFCGINPSLYTAATGHHFARPGNRFWPALHRAGFTDRLLTPAEQDLLPGYGLGITNVVARATARAAELSTAEYRAGGTALAAKLARLRPTWLAVLGITAYRAAFGAPDAGVGPAPEPIGTTRVWVLPSPSGLNAHWTLPALASVYGELRAAAA